MRLLCIWGLLFICSLRVKKNWCFETADRCATYRWGSLMTQNLTLKQDCWVSLPKAFDLPTTLHLVIHLCSSSLTIVQLPEVCQNWSSATKFPLVDYTKQFLLSKVSWRRALHGEEEGREKVRERPGDTVVKCRMGNDWLWKEHVFCSIVFFLLFWEVRK